MIKHCVFLSLRVSDDFSALDEPMRLLNELVGKIPGMLDFSHGPNLDYENKTTSYQYGFVSTFLDRAAHLEYEGHLDHERAGGMLINACKGGYEGILVADLETST